MTLTKVVDSASREYARLYNDGLVPQDFAVRASEAHLAYRKAAGVAGDALAAYKQSGDRTAFNAAIESARSAATKFVDLITPLLTKEQATTFRTQITQATTL